MPLFLSNRIAVIGIIIALCGVIFALDLIIPLGVALAVPYIFPLLVTMCLPDKKITLWTAVGCSGLTILGLYLSPAEGVLWQVLSNRALALFAIWVVATFIIFRKRSEDELEKSKERFDLSIKGSSDGFWDWDITINQLWWSPRFYELLGYKDREIEITYQTMMECIYPEDREVVEKAIQAHLKEHLHYDIEYRYKFKSGRYCWFRGRGQATWDETGNPTRMSGSVQDISEQKQAKEALNQSERTLKEAERIAHLGSWDWNIVTGELFWSEESCRIFGFLPNETKLTFEIIKNLIHPDDREDMVRKVNAAVYDNTDYETEYRIVLPSGEVRHIYAQGEIVRDADEVSVHFVGTFLDVTERKRTEELLKENEERFRHMAHHDTLTGLPNRALLRDRLQQAIAIAKRDKKHLAVMFLDLDKFKPVNDMYGHYVGDLLLKEAAKRIQDSVRESDTVARISGDEFIVLSSAIEQKQDVMMVAEKIRHTLNQPFELAGQNLQISSSIGIAIYPEHGADENQILKNADIAMYYAKDSGRNKVQLFQLDLLGGKT